MLKKVQAVGFEPTQLSLPDLETGSLDHSDMLTYQIPWVSTRSSSELNGHYVPITGFDPVTSSLWGK